jgi:c-di-GMP-binding flagellar brake protein YcgR
MEKKVGNNLDKIMVDTIQKSHSVYAWKSVNGVIEKCELKVKAFRKGYGEIELEVTEREVQNIANVISGDRELNFYIPEESVSFKCSLIKMLEGKKFKVTVPETFEFFERRKHERVQPKKCFLTFIFNKVSYKKPVFDISMGGVAIVLPKAEKMMLKKGFQADICFIEFGEIKMKVKLECVATVSIDRFKLDSLPYGANKIAFRFTSMSLEGRDTLSELILMESIRNKQLKGA